MLFCSNCVLTINHQSMAYGAATCNYVDSVSMKFRYLLLSTLSSKFSKLQTYLKFGLILLFNCHISHFLQIKSTSKLCIATLLANSLSLTSATIPYMFVSILYKLISLYLCVIYYLSVSTAYINVNQYSISFQVSTFFQHIPMYS
jgi:hypothetical protein